MNTKYRTALAAVIAIQQDNCAAMVMDRNGDNPACKNKIGTWKCERCGADVRSTKGACVAAPPEKRWRFQ